MKHYILSGIAALTLGFGSGCITNQENCMKDLRTEYEQMMNQSEIDPAKRVRYEKNMIDCERKIKKQQDEADDDLLWYIILSSKDSSNYVTERRA